jgi:hypothetical protein
MRSEYEARWISKPRLESIRKSNIIGQAVVLDSFNGFLIVEPRGSKLGDGTVLSREEADYELTPVWCSGPKAKLRGARKLLGLETHEPSTELVEIL